ncbi:MAG: 3-phosphoshikimate 1-carboxyvinyltransferase [Microbacterium sp. SCN 70-200]|mgnify:CR=1 FL=1|uniref:3-phosphoshikimate 1-carboxyvinyltransferase n=1 Tax=unclassified Microbacterium TaxID=2609290 RepID=UPI00086A3D35|nr:MULTISPECIES: 3-phosphoshikimate 1-carboxyvinyltransferase [unclassified Microbacterium]MBN9213903.1 3-phosphoshikimate 1-carboxyvinyltransferase [Microbacterium sp.]ODT42444.1 MAG: 3-phosphoshikimate 1-carboxyvinyltransferase [Microbacterium sp. SCN 70-200]OJV85428.1 MAG: 3-phosphoshikimate 1-carboxyvinyltransferase [Microbacterium sp. 70-16]
MTTSGYSLPQSASSSPWPAPRLETPVQATVVVPGSKSLTNRKLVLAALSDAPSTLSAPLHSEDSARMVDALRALGATIDEVPGDGAFGPDLHVTPPAAFHGDVTIDCGQAGTVMRFIAPLAGLATGDVTITAHASALHRPMGEMIKALREIGADIDDGGHWALPFTVRGRGHIRGGEVTIDASASSQFVSGLLLAAPRFDVGLHLIHSGERLPSIPHIDMTVETLARRGIQVERPNANEWLVPAGVPRGRDTAIEPDLSNAAPFLAAALLTGGSVTIPGWPPTSTQPGALLPEILALLGARTGRRGGALTVTGTGRVAGVDLDLTAASELTPTLFALAAFADAPTTLHGIGHIRGHETNRIDALVTNLQRLGGTAEELPDGIRITPVPLHGGLWRAHHDHRIATAGALIGLRVPGVEVDDIGTTAKTMPEFPQLWHDMIVADGVGTP